MVQASKYKVEILLTVIVECLYLWELMEQRQKYKIWSNMVPPSRNYSCSLLEYGTDCGTENENKTFTLTG